MWRGKAANVEPALEDTGGVGRRQMSKERQRFHRLREKT